MEILKKVQADFREVFGEGKMENFFSPGRVNLIGEHTDYNGGHVFPCAISLGTYGVVSRRQDRKFRLYSENFPAIGIVEVDLDHIVYDKAKYDWGNYPMGVIKTFQNHGLEIPFGLDIVLYGNLPNGAGLSSSASVEVLMAVILNTIFDLKQDMVELVKMCQEAENQFVGVNCGIMDQFAIGMGKQSHAILLDCNTLNYRYSKIALDGYQIVIMNTNKKRGLGDSKYNERRSECEQALADLQKVKSIHSLGELTEAEFDEISGAIQNPIHKKRARHAVLENQRTLQAVKALENNDLALFGKLMNASHVSLRDDYEVTGKELDALAQAAWQYEYVVGARMTGAGFGGCAVSIVKEDCIEEFKQKVGAEYKEKIGYEPSFYVADIANGSSKLG